MKLIQNQHVADKSYVNSIDILISIFLIFQLNPLIWMGFLGAIFEVGEGVKLPLPPPCLNLARIMLET